MGAATIRPKVSANPIIIAFKIISLEPLLKMMFTFTETNRKVPIISARSILAPFPSSPSPSQLAPPIVPHNLATATSTESLFF